METNPKTLPTYIKNSPKPSHIEIKNSLQPLPDFILKPHLKPLPMISKTQPKLLPLFKPHPKLLPLSFKTHLKPLPVILIAPFYLQLPLPFTFPSFSSKSSKCFIKKDLRLMASFPSPPFPFSPLPPFSFFYSFSPFFIIFINV